MICVLLGTNHELATYIQAAFDWGWVWVWAGGCNQKYPKGEDETWGTILKGELDLPGNIAPATKIAVSTQYMYNEEW